MKMHFKFYPIDKPEVDRSGLDRNLIILHGLFGSSKNWVSVSKQLTKFYNVYSVDLRNHGDSPHSAEHTIPAMAGDLHEFILEHSLNRVSLLGHSMGGLVSMFFDLTHPKAIEFLMIQDIIPRTYPFSYDNEIKAMSIELTDAKSRSDIDILMKDKVPDVFIRQFLQMNLERSHEGKYFWKLNVDGINQSRNLFSNVFEDLKPSLTPALFVLGGVSEYVQKSDFEIIEGFYPSANIQTIPGGGHYIHYTHSEEFMKIIYDFINSVKN